MNLSIKDRLNFPVLYPRESNLIKQLIIRDIIKKVDFSQGEISEFELEQKESHFQWNPKKAKEIEVVFTQAETAFLKEQVDKLDKDSRVTQEILELCLAIKNI